MIVTDARLAPPDARAIRILMDTYWSSAGWRDALNPQTPPEDFEYAKRVGVMFEPELLTHDELIERAMQAARSVRQDDVVNAFVISLASRRLDLRSALGSFAILRHVGPHELVRHQGYCRYCGAYLDAENGQDLNVLNFERFKWGGVRHDEVRYAEFDLRLFSRLNIPAPSLADVSTLKTLLDAMEASPPNTTAATLQKYLSPVLKSSKDERDQLIAILGICGMLGVKEYPGYMNAFIPWEERDIPARRNVDMSFPACWWTRADGVNAEAVRHWFGPLLD